MGRRDDVKKLYLPSDIIKCVVKGLFWMNIICSVALLTFKTDTVSNVILVVQILASILYVLLTIVGENFFWYNAEKTRRQVAVEDGFGIEMTEYKTNAYYNNDFSNNSTKFSINIFESVMFSKTTASRMIVSASFKMGLAILAFIVTCLVSKHYGIVLIMSQAVFSAYFFEEYVALLIYKLRLERLYDDFYKELITIGIKCVDQKSLLLTYAIEYEVIKAHYKVSLSEKEFKKHNLETSKEWDEICKKIKIKNDCIS